VSVFLPGFKADKVVDVPITAGQWGGGTLWQTPVRYPVLRAAPPSTATVWMSPDRHLLKLAMELHEPRGSGSGVLTLEGCEGSTVMSGILPR
jgi:hypothetical protein